jgi:4-hydroxybenzoate polyprenyltransferase
MAFVQVAVGILNDYCDRDLDAVAKPRRPLPAGLVRPRWALLSGSLSLALGLTTAAALGADSALVLAVGAGMGVLYSVVFKRSFLSWLPYAVAYPIVPIWVWVSLGKFRPDLLVVLPASIPLSIGVHLCNQLRDYDEDAKLGMKGLAQYLGKAAAATTCLGLLVFGPLLGLLFHRHAGIGGLLLLSAATLVHWVLVSHCLVRNGNRFDPNLWRELFRSLQLSGPLLLSTWLLAAGP